MHATPRFPRVASYICFALFLNACGDGPTDPSSHQPGVRAVVGAGVTDTVDTQLLQALVVEVRGSGGTLASGTLVRFEAQPPVTNPGPYYQPAVYVCALAAPICGGAQGGGSQFITDTTDAQGRAKVIVRLGQVAGRAVVRLVVPEFGLVDSATFAVMPGAGVGLRALADTSLDIGATAMLRGRVVDRYNNPRTDPTTISAGLGSAITLDAATGIVTARDIGMQWLFVRYNSFVDSTNVRVVPSGRLVVWSSNERVVRLVNLNGGDERTLVSSVSSDLGAFPRFDGTRQRVTLHAGNPSYGGPPSNIIVVDTSGSSRRDISASIGFDMVIATRQLADGTLLVVGQRSADTLHPGYSLWRVATDNTITFLVALPGLGSTYGGADISHAGAQVVYVAYTSSSTSELRVVDVSSGSTTLLDANTTSSPRWSAQDNRVAYLIPNGAPQYFGVAVVINADGTGRSMPGSPMLSPGIAWSPDGKYIVSRASDGAGLWVVRVSDGANVLARFRFGGTFHDYWQPDWR